MKIPDNIYDGHIRRLVAADVKEIAVIHRAAFPNSALTVAGLGAVTRYYRWLLTGPHDALEIGVQDEGCLVGFCFAGKFRQVMSGFVRRNWAYLSCAILLRPWILFNPYIRHRIYIALMVLLGVPVSTDLVWAFARSLGLLALAVDPAYCRRGAGGSLMDACESVGVANGFDLMHLTVATGNERAVRFYEGRGWRKYPDASEWRGFMVKKLSQRCEGARCPVLPSVCAVAQTADTMRGGVRVPKYASPLLSVGAALLAALMLNSVRGTELWSFGLYYVAVALSAVLGGVVAGSIAALLGGVAAALGGADDSVGLAVFFIASSALVYLGHTQYKARRLLNADVADRRSVEAAERLQRQRFEVALFSLEDAVITTDNGGRVTFMNPAAAAMTGWERSEAVGQDIDAICRVWREGTWAGLPVPITDKPSEGSVIVRYEAELLSKSGARMAADIKAVPIVSASEEAIGAALLLRRRTEAARAAMRTAAAQP